MTKKNIQRVLLKKKTKFLEQPYSMNEKPTIDFFKNPDKHLAAIRFGEDQVFASIKGSLGLIEGIPDPRTGFHFLDIVEVENLNIVTKFRDEEIPVFAARALVTRSQFSTFEFEAIIPAEKDRFALIDLFRTPGLCVEFPHNERDSMMNFRKGLCATLTIEEAKSLLEIFAASGHNRHVRKLKDPLNPLAHEIEVIDEENATLVLQHSRTQLPYVILLCAALPISLLISLAFSIGLHSILQLVSFFGMVLFFSAVGVYVYFYYQRHTISLNNKGIVADYPFSQQHRIEWKDLDTVKFTVNKMDLYLRSPATKITVNRGLAGFRLFCKIVTKRTGKETL